MASKPNPKEKKEEVKVVEEPKLSSEETIKAFFDEFPGTDEREAIVVGIAGYAGLGKTHFINTFPNPVIADTEARAQIVMNKFDGFRLRKITKNMAQIRQTVQVIAEHVCPDSSKRNQYTFALDSSSDFQQMAESEYLKEAKKEKVYPLVLWSKIFDKMDKIFDVVRELGLNAVFTQQLKEEYEGEKKTGQLIPAGYKKLPYRVDVHLHLRKGIEFEGDLYYPDVIVAEVLKDCWHIPSEAKPYLLDVSYDGLFNELKAYKHPAPGDMNVAIQKVLHELEVKTGIPINKAKTQNKEG